MRMYPSLDSTTPEPFPPEDKPATLIVTTAGAAVADAAVAQLTFSRSLTTIAAGRVR